MVGRECGILGHRDYNAAYRAKFSTASAR
jgi:hypothetical protein